MRTIEWKEEMLLKSKSKSTANTATTTEKSEDAPPSPADMTAPLTPAATAAILSVTAKALERGRRPVFVRLSAKSIRYRKEDVAAFVECRLRCNTAGR